MGELRHDQPDHSPYDSTDYGLDIVEKKSEVIDFWQIRRERIAREVTDVADKFLEAVNKEEVINPTESERKTRVTMESVDSDAYNIGEWEPSGVFVYKSYDPFQEFNPGLTTAATKLIEDITKITEALKETNDPTLTYLDPRRAKHGKRSTIVTQALIGMDEGFGDWVCGLPAAERLRPVAHPWSDSGTILIDDNNEPVIKRSTKAMSALLGGGGDGRGVREREAWGREVLPTIISSKDSDDIIITSLGTGTGESAMDTGIEVMNRRGDSRGTVIVNGFDINSDSLVIATHIAARKQEELEESTKLVFNGAPANLLTRDGIKDAVGSTAPHIVEAMGFAEYVPRAHPKDPIEQKQRTAMEKLGCLSAEEFYQEIYKNMPVGSVLITGNMRDDSKQAAFVVDAVGWKGIIQRSTMDYLEILRDAGIPGQAVNLYVPDPTHSSGVYNLVTITKQVA